MKKERKYEIDKNMINEEEMGIIERLGKQLSEISERLSNEGKYSPELNDVIDEYDNSDWMHNEAIARILTRRMTSVIYKAMSNHIAVKDYATQVRKKKPSKSTKRKSVKKCKCK